MKIIRFRCKSDMDVQFLDEHGYIKEHAMYINFIKGNIKNPYDKSVHGVGCIGLGRHKTELERYKLNPAYVCWASMLERCYIKNDLHPAYYDISTVCNEWLNFQVFADWYEEHKYECDGRLHIDKDILCPGNKVYSPDTCILVPQRINMLFVNKPNSRGLPNGIRMAGKKFEAFYSNMTLGKFDTLDEAYDVYSKYKKNVIIEIAEEYKDVIPKKLYNALYFYEIDINNDKNYRKVS